MAKGPRKIWDNCQPIGEVMKSNSTKLIIQLVAKDGVKYINIREMYKKKSDTVWKFGMQGVAIPLSIPIEGQGLTNVDCELITAMEKARALSKDFAIEDEANAVYAKE